MKNRTGFYFIVLVRIIFRLGEAYVIPLASNFLKKSCFIKKDQRHDGRMIFQHFVAAAPDMEEADEEEKRKSSAPKIAVLPDTSNSPLNKQNRSLRQEETSSNRTREQRMSKSPEQVEEELTVALDALRDATVSAEETPSALTSIHLLIFPTVRECNEALAAFGDAPDLLRALRVFGKMRKAAALKQALQQAITSTASSISNHTSSISNVTSWPVPAPTLVTYSTLMSRFVKADKPAVALRLWNLMIGEADIVEIDVKAANILMNCYAKMADVDAAQNLLHKMKQQEKIEVTNGNVSFESKIRLPPPNSITYNTLLSACHKAGDLDVAVAAVGDMKAQRLPADVRTYTSLIATVARQSSKAAGRYDPTPAFQFLADMRDQGIQPNGMTYSALIDACGRCKRSDLALQGLRMMLRQRAQEQKALEDAQTEDSRMAKKYILPNEVGAWTAAINACGRSGRLKTAIRLFNAMPNFGVKPNTVTCGSLTDSLLRAGLTSETLDVLRYMKANGIPPSEVMYTSLMARAEKLVEMERRNRQRQDARIRHIHPRSDNIVPEKELDGGAGGSREDIKAIEVYTELIQSLIDGTDDSARYGDKYRKQKRLTQDEDSNSLLLLKVFLVFQQMKMAGVEVDLPCYNTLLRACAKAGDVTRAQDVLQKMQANNLDPNDTSWRLLLRSASTAATTKNGPRHNRADTVKVAESIWRQGISYRRSRRLIDEPDRQQWTPSINSLMTLIAVYMREAAAISATGRVGKSESKSYYRRVVQLYEDILMGQNEEMGMDRIDQDRLLDTPHAMLVILQAIVALEKLESKSWERGYLRRMATSILKLPCFEEYNRHAFGHPVQEALQTARSWAR